MRLLLEGINGRTKAKHECFNRISMGAEAVRK